MGLPVRLGSVLLAAALAGDGARTPPFTAWVEAPEILVRATAARAARPVGMLERGDRVTVTSCEPACDADGGWALLSPRGALPLRVLVPEPPDGGARWDARLVHGHVAAEVPIRGAPARDAGIVARVAQEETAAFVEDAALLDAGWLERPSGGFVDARQVRLIHPSGFEGVHLPPAQVAFFLRSTKARGAPDAGLGPAVIARHDWREVLGVERDRVRVAEGTVPRSAVRLARKRPRPHEVPETARWVDIDTGEQVLTAYEGDALVFATLISSGKVGFRTRPGLYRVWFKARHATMVGQREPYRVEQVPDALFFHDSDALHSGFWHDHFGRAGSHGCVNLSPLDARWLFDWAPPALPDGWHGVMVLPEDDSLWVNVHGAAPVGA